MGPGLDGAPVVTGGDDHRIDAVHDAFVVRRRTVGISGGKGIRLHNSVGDIVSGEIVKSEGGGGDAALSTGQTAICQIGQNAQAHPPAGDTLQRSG